MKKIINLILCLTLVTFMSLTCLVTADDGQYVDLNKSAEVVNQFIIDSVAMGDVTWNNFTIIGYEEIYDANLNHYGYVFNLNNAINEGYAIVVKNSDGTYIVTEISNQMSSPYANNNEDYNVYFNSLEYYGASKSKSRSSNIVLNDLSSDYSLSNDEARYDKFEYVPQTSANTRALGSVAGYSYVKNYNTKFENHHQVYDNSCLPASFAMSLKYLHNIGELTLLNPYTDMNEIDDKLYSYANCVSTTYCYASNIKSALSKFSANYISGRTVYTFDDGFQPDTYISQARYEVDQDCPPIIIFYKGALVTSEKLNHAVTMLGYKVFRNNETGVVTSYTNYIVISDPITESQTTVLWSSSRVYDTCLL